MKKVRQLLLCSLVFIFCSLPLLAFDFGLILDQNADVGGFGSGADFAGDSSFTYSGILTPRFSAMLGDNADLYISAGLEASYN